MMSYPKLKTAQRLLRNRDGNIAVISGLLMPLVALFAMTSIDISHKYDVRTKMQASIDAALLAATLEAQSLPQDATDQERQDALEEVFEDFYSANFAKLMYKDGNAFSLQNDDYNLEYDKSSEKVSAQVQFEYDGVASKLISSYEPSIGVSAITNLTVVKDHYIIDLVMCIDATGSMQATLDAVKAAANTFNTDLRAELTVPEENLKVRVRPIFYRDWDDQYYYDNPTADPYPSYPGWWDWYVNTYLGGRQNYEGGMVYYPSSNGFIDLDPSDASGVDADVQATNFTTFIGSERAAGGFDWPEGAGACLNEGIRSDWFDNQSQEAKDYFGIPSGNTIININEDKPEGEYSRVTTIPVIVFWTDATINSLSLSQQYLSSTTPTSYTSFEQLWNNASNIDQDLKLLIHFGPNSGQGWNNVKLWDRYKFGGTLADGNSEGVARIAEEISNSVPDILRISN